MRRAAAGIGWLVIATAALYVYLAHRPWLRAQLDASLNQPPLLAALVVFVLGALRGFTLIPATVLVLAAMPFLAPTTLLLAILAGIVCASATIYFFSSTLGLVDLAERHDAHRVALLRRWLDRYQFPVIVAWSFFPLAPTDLICALCGSLRVRVVPFLAAVTLGEGAICALYIYGANGLLRWLELR
ncbi:MAG: VTT domain-containing protein [Acidobacteriota bacterium]